MKYIWITGKENAKLLANHPFFKMDMTLNMFNGIKIDTKYLIVGIKFNTFAR